MKVLRIIAVVTFCLYIINSIFDTNDKEGNQISTMTKYTTQLKKIFKNFNKVKKRSKHTRSIISSTGAEIGILYLEPYGDDKRQRGYNGKIKLAVATDPYGEILGVLIGENMETPSFMQYISKSGFLAKWNRLSVGQVSTHEVDAVTGATISSNAIAHGIKQLAIKHSNTPEIVVKKSFGKIKDIVLFVWLFVMLFFSTKIKYRKLILVSNVVILGFMLKGLFSIELLGGIVNANFAQFGLSIGFIAVLLFTWYYGKNVYCIWICPFGAIQILSFGINKKFKINLSHNLQKYLRFFRLLFLIAVLVLLIADIGNLFAYINPFSIFYSVLNLKDTAVIIALVSIICSLFINRPWCRTCCPVGALIDLSSHYSKKRLKTGT